MKTYTVLYAADVPHYARFEVQAPTAEDAILAAKAHVKGPDIFLEDPDWDNTILQRIVHIEDANGIVVASDIPLDKYVLQGGAA